MLDIENLPQSELAMKTLAAQKDVFWARKVLKIACFKTVIQGMDKESGATLSNIIGRDLIDDLAHEYPHKDQTEMIQELTKDADELIGKIASDLEMFPLQ